VIIIRFSDHVQIGIGIGKIGGRNMHRGAPNRRCRSIDR
jgi:hypothetical protein